MGRVERSSLSQRLLRGLHSTMMKMSPAQRAVYVPLQVANFVLRTLLTNHVLEVGNREGERNVVL